MIDHVGWTLILLGAVGAGCLRGHQRVLYSAAMIFGLVALYSVCACAIVTFLFFVSCCAFLFLSVYYAEFEQHRGGLAKCLVWLFVGGVAAYGDWRGMPSVCHTAALKDISTTLLREHWQALGIFVCILWGGLLNVYHALSVSKEPASVH